MSHAGNWDRNPRKLALERSRALALVKGAEAEGWIRIGDSWQPSRTVAAAILRRAQIQGACRTHECSRRVRLDLEGWKKAGLGDVILSEVERLLKCGKVGCRFALGSDTYPHGAPFFLEHRPGAKLLITCRNCDAASLMTFEAFHAKIVPAGGSANTTLLNLAGLIRRRCPRCEALAWRVSVQPPPTPEKAAR